MRIDVLNIDGLDRSLEGWRLSRHQSAAASWDEVYTLDLPVNELPSAVLNFQDFTIIEREIFTTPRNHVAWARTSHVDDPLLARVPMALQSPTSNAEHFAAMRREKDQGLSQDEWRRHLPVTSMTSWTTRMSFRDLVKITNYFDYLDGHEVIKPHALSVRFAMVREKLKQVIDKFTGSPTKSDKALAASLKVNFLNEGTIRRRETTTTSGFYLMTIEVPLWLRAQIVRHRPLSFVDDFFFKVIASPNVLELTIETPIVMEIASPREFWRSVLSKRTCWLAQDALAGGQIDPWQQMIAQFGFREEMLPCANGKCPYHGDAALRVSGSDPGVPCPRHMNLNNLDKKDHVEAMKVAARSRDPYWLKEIAQ